MKKLIIITFLFFICEVIYSQNKREVNYEAKYKFSSSSKTSKIEFVCLIPQDIDNIQKVISIDYSIPPQKEFVRNGNKYAEFVINSPRKKEELIISVNLSIFRIDYSTVVDEGLFINDSLSGFLDSEKYIEKDNSSIIRVAKKLIGKDTIETIKNIYNYVYEEIKYSGFNTNDLGAVKALRGKKGDCTEFSDLFVALCRANNIHARIIEGYTTDYENTPNHIWAEVYTIKYGWIRFDPTPGNSSSFEINKNRYIQLSNVRNDSVLTNGHFWTLRYMGGEVRIKEEFIVK